MFIEDIVNNVKVYGLEESIKRAKYPMSVSPDTLTTELTKGITALAQSKSGEGHDNWLCGIIVQFDLTFSVKAWTEAERYHFFDIISSQSTMHRIARFDYSKSYMPYVDDVVIGRMKLLLDEYNKWSQLYDMCQSDDGKRELKEQKDIAYLRLLYSNPCGFKLTAGMSTNYRQLKTIYKQRKEHRLPEWQLFCKWIETLPHAELITGENK